MSATGDMTFGSGTANFLINTPQAVRQSIVTRLNLWTGQWYLDGTEGTPWATSVLGKNSKATYDLAITDRILGTLGVLNIINYTSELNPTTRVLTFSADVNTLYGTTDINSTLVSL